MSSNLISNNDQSGFIALLSTIVIGAVLLVMTIEAGKSGFYTSILVLGNEAKELSKILALECGHRTVTSIISKTTFANNSIFINEIGSCEIYEIKKEYPNSEYVTINIKSKVRNSITNLELVYKIGNLYLGEDTQSYSLTREFLSEPELYSIKEIPVMP